LTADVDVNQEPTPVRRRTGVWWRVLRAVLVALWLVGATTAWWTEPHHAQLRDAEEDLGLHRVAVVCWGDRWQGQSGVGAWITQPQLVSDSADVDRIFAWRTTSGRVYYTNVDEPGPAYDGVADSPSAELARKVLVPALAGTRIMEDCGSPRSRCSAWPLWCYWSGDRGERLPAGGAGRGPRRGDVVTAMPRRGRTLRLPRPQEHLKHLENLTNPWTRHKRIYRL
jgi:hypothetical protein